MESLEPLGPQSVCILWPQLHGMTSWPKEPPSGSGLPGSLLQRLMGRADRASTQLSLQGEKTAPDDEAGVGASGAFLLQQK